MFLGLKAGRSTLSRVLRRTPDEIKVDVRTDVGIGLGHWSHFRLWWEALHNGDGSLTASGGVGVVERVKS